jgi:hypothetical protein
VDAAHALQLRRHHDPYLVFSSHDPSRSGTLPLREARKALSSLGCPLTALETANLARAHGDGNRIDYGALLRASGVRVPEDGAAFGTPSRVFLHLGATRGHFASPLSERDAVGALLVNSSTPQPRAGGAAEPAVQAPWERDEVLPPPPPPAAPAGSPAGGPLSSSSVASAAVGEGRRRHLLPTFLGSVDTSAGLGPFISQPAPVPPLRRHADKNATVGEEAPPLPPPARRRFSATQFLESDAQQQHVHSSSSSSSSSTSTISSFSAATAASAEAAPLTRPLGEGACSVAAMEAAAGGAAPLSTPAAAAAVSAVVLSVIRSALPAAPGPARIRLREALTKVDGDGDGSVNTMEALRAFNTLIPPQLGCVRAREVGLLARWLSDRGGLLMPGQEGSASDPLPVAAAGASRPSGSASTIPLHSLLAAVEEGLGSEARGIERVENTGAVPPWGVMGGMGSLPGSSSGSPAGGGSAGGGSYERSHRRRLSAAAAALSGTGVAKRTAPTAATTASGSSERGAGAPAVVGAGGGAQAQAGGAADLKSRKFTEFLAAWHSKHGEAARRESSADAVEAAGGSGPTWASASPSIFKVLHLRGAAPPPPAPTTAK